MVTRAWICSSDATRLRDIWSGVVVGEDGPWAELCGIVRRALAHCDRTAPASRRDDGDDLCQEVCARIWKRVRLAERSDAVTDDDSCAGFVARVATSVWLDSRRRERQPADLESAGDPAGEQTPDLCRERIAWSELHTRLACLIGGVRLDAIWLRFVSGLSYGDAAALMFGSTDARSTHRVAAAISRGRQELSYECIADLLAAFRLPAEPPPAIVPRRNRADEAT